MSFGRSDFMTHNGVEYVSVNGAAEIAGVHHQTIRKWIASSRLTTFHPNGRSKAWLRVDDVHAAKKVAREAPRGRAVPLSDREREILLDEGLTGTEAAFLTGRASDAAKNYRRHQRRVS